MPGNITEARDRLVAFRRTQKDQEEKIQINELSLLHGEIIELYSALEVTHPQGIQIDKHSMEIMLPGDLWPYFDNELTLSMSHTLRLSPARSSDQKYPAIRFSVVDSGHAPSDARFERLSLLVLAEGQIALRFHEFTPTNEGSEQIADRINSQLVTKEHFDRNRTLLTYVKPLVGLARETYLEAVNKETGPRQMGGISEG